MPPRIKRTSKYYEQRRKDVEKNHGLWVRNDLWNSLKAYSEKENVTMKWVVNEALFRFLKQEDIELKTGLPTHFLDTIYDQQRGTLRKDEAETYIKE